jgi:hypothetical protein
MMDTYTDEHGYRRFSDSDKLVHRWVAYKYLYDPDHYSDPFSYYQIHHNYAESKIFIYGAIFWILTIPITGAIGVLFAIICAVLHWWKKNSE